MTALTYDKTHSNGAGGHRGRWDVTTQVPGLLDTSGHDHRDGGTPPARILGSVREFPVLRSGSLPRELERLAHLTSYSWFSKDHFGQALEWLGVILKLCGSSHTADRQAVGWLIPAICDLHQKDVDLYHRDRAVKAAEVIPGRPTPLRRDQIPQRIWNKSEHILRMSSLRWTPDAPVEATNRLTALFPHAKPDQLWLATYEERRRSATYDPLIYAQYGNWWVKVAEWA